MIYYGLNRRLNGDNGEAVNSQPNIVRNPLYKTFDIFSRFKFTEEDQKDLQFLCQAVKSKWITYDEIRTNLYDD